MAQFFTTTVIDKNLFMIKAPKKDRNLARNHEEAKKPKILIPRFELFKTF